MRVSDLVRQCVAYIGAPKLDGSAEIGGTGFFVAKPAPGICGTSSYGVARAYDRNVHVLRDGAAWYGKTRNWKPIGAVTLNPERDSIGPVIFATRASLRKTVSETMWCSR